ncbi:hypothetical protein J2X02_001403 [Pseudoxanthomonas japonensis]|jgi:hypothetical protein|nr:hypothetical protein [Pseudoxanthomonas japonensis]
MHMELVAVVESAWDWTGLEPDQIVGDNDFGNLLINDKQGRYWRLCSEDLYRRAVADSRAELDRLSQNQEFLHDWHMTCFAGNRARGASISSTAPRAPAE